MRAVIQKVKKASVSVDGSICGQIGRGLCVLAAISATDDDKVMQWMANKIAGLRVFDDEEGRMNLSVQDAGGDILLISNFTVYGDCRKGFRPSYMKSAPAEISGPAFEKFVRLMRGQYDFKVETGQFGAMMEVEIINDGPVTIVLDKEA